MVPGARLHCPSSLWSHWERSSSLLSVRGRVSPGGASLRHHPNPLPEELGEGDKMLQLKFEMDAKATHSPKNSLLYGKTQSVWLHRRQEKV